MTLLVSVGDIKPATAANDAGCASFGSSFTAQPIAGNGTGLRLGCARDAGSLRSLAKSDGDMVAVIDFKVTERPDQWRQVMNQMVDTTRADMARGLSLSKALTLRSQRYSGGFAPQTNSVTFGGNIHTVDDSIVLVVPAGDIGTAGFWEGFWKKFVSNAAGVAVGVASTALCLLAFNVGAPAAAPVCGAVGGALLSGVAELVGVALDGKPIDATAWGQALGSAAWGAIAGASAGLLAEYLAVGGRGLIASTQETLRRYATIFTNWRAPLNFLADLLSPDIAQIIADTVQRLARGIPSTQIRVMALGSSSTWGEGSSDGNGYRDTVDVGLQGIAERNAQQAGNASARPAAEVGTLGSDDTTPEVDWVGSVRVGTMSDRETEGWRGYRINEIAGKADCSVKRYRPNVITLIAGGNDVIMNYQMDGAVGRLEALIDQITTDVPRATVLVAGMQPFLDPARNARGEAFTAQIPALVDRLVARGLSVVYADTTALEPADIHTSDGIHPTDRGYDKIGAAFLKAANVANDRRWILEPVGQVPEGASDADSCPTRDDGTGAGDNGSSQLGPGWDDHGVIQAQQFPSTNRFWMVDVNKDRKAEFVTVDEKQNFRFWWNSGPSGKNWTPFIEGENSYTPPAGAVGNQLRFADLDGDGFPDCAVVDLTGRIRAYTWKAENPAGQRMCMNKYNGLADVFDQGSQGEILRTDPTTKIRFADVTGGGRDDYLLIKPDGTTTAWYNRGFQSEAGRRWLDWTPPHTISRALQKPREIRYADINGDKRADRILITARGGARAWINEGATGAGGTYRDIGKIAADGNLPPKDIQFADLDGDGKDDFVRIGWTGVTHAWLNKLPASYFNSFHP
ncbi:FG-GAP-like repeat-containing protein [Streptomyces sp. NBC_00654]|uniref:FG-GAP-like repeat-containing protein n=1 Tax=Streptomyces sp. NBC_00654 TaxID=2975799 RepID=UPI00225C3679|nr:FG-GAP-like repeat-containing protein [Streptomyces sp. NBC_00654]MCX4971094.1 FG-GAP-like repeat-containing protein [Streptomyces sp. NBC_00654]